MPCIVNRETSVVPVVFLGLATLFLVLSSVSAPLVDSVRLFRIHANISGARRYVDFGIWGYCVVPIRGYVVPLGPLVRHVTLLFMQVQGIRCQRDRWMFDSNIGVYHRRSRYKRAVRTFSYYNYILPTQRRVLKSYF